jgi:hypothetical protein
MKKLKMEVERIQMKLGNRLFAVDVKQDQPYEDKLIEAKREISKQIQLNNERPATIFFEELEPVCSECGILLTNGEEPGDLICLQCQENPKPQKYCSVKIPVYETITVTIKKPENDSDIESIAIEKAIKEQPKVCWQVDDNIEIEVEEHE